MTEELLVTALRTIVAPLVEADEGELYALEVGPERVRLHLRGKFSGCPGNGLVAEQVILPILRRAHPQVTLDLSSGPLVPEGARRILPHPQEP